jgi:DNA repair protein SbcC/Rad50
VITSIELKNWKTHKSTRMQFSQGANVIIGVMGAGKSSIMDAISFALFGTFPALNHKRASLANLIMSRPTKELRAEIILEFTAKGGKYKVIRKIEGDSGSTAFLEKEGKYVQTQAERVNEEISRLLGIDYDTFSRAVYAEQNRLDYFLDLRKGERKNQIDMMLGLDRFATAEENTTSLINNIRGLIADEEETLSKTDSAGLKDKLAIINEEISKAREETKLLQVESKVRAESSAKLTAEVEEAKRKYAAKLKLSTQLTQLETKEKTLKEEIAKIAALSIDEEAVLKGKESIQKRLEEATLKLDSIKKEERELTRSISGIEERIRGLEKELKEKEKLLSITKGKDKAEFERKIKEENGLLEKMLEKAASSKSSRSEAEKFQEELAEHIGKCPVCERELDELMRKSILQSKSELIERLKKEIAESEASISKKKGSILELNDEHKRLSVASERLMGYADVEAKLDTDRSKREELAKKVVTISESVKAAESSKEKISTEMNEIKGKEESLIRKKGYESQILQMGSELITIKKELKENDMDEKRLYGLQEILSKESSRLKEIRAKIDGAEKYSKSLEGQADGIVREMATINAIRERLEKRRKMLENLNKFKSALVDAGAALRNRLVLSINQLMHGIWRDIYPYRDYEDLRLSAKKDDYILEASARSPEGLVWLPVDSVASGGERSIACLSMRIALSMVVVPNLKWIILDEPTHNIDNNGIEKLVNVISDLLPKIVEQIFIITHEDRLKQIPTAKIYQLERNKEESGATEVLEI